MHRIFCQDLGLGVLIPLDRQWAFKCEPLLDQIEYFRVSKC